MQPSYAAVRPAGINADVDAYITALETQLAGQQAELHEARATIAALAGTVNSLSREVRREAIPMSAESQGPGVYYRLICEHCVHPIEIPHSALSSHNEGAGSDYDGSYDSGYTVTTAKCTRCQGAIHRMGSLDTNLKNKAIFKVAH